MAEGKTKAHCQDQLGELCHTQEALQEKVVGLRKGGTAQAPYPLLPYQPPFLDPRHLMHGRVLPHEMSQAPSATENVKEDVAKLQTEERVQEAQVRFKEQNPLGTFMTKAWQARDAWKEQRETLRWHAWKRKMQRQKIILTLKQTCTQHQSPSMNTLI